MIDTNIRTDTVTDQNIWTAFSNIGIIYFRIMHGFWEASDRHQFDALSVAVTLDGHGGRDCVTNKEGHPNDPMRAHMDGRRRQFPF
jgi:hypothetical protein